MAITITRECMCPLPEERIFCVNAIAEDKLCLLPPALAPEVDELGNVTNTLTITLAITDTPVVEVVCAGVACLCGVFDKTVSYFTPGEEGPTETFETTQVPFQKCIENCAIGVNDNIAVTSFAPLCGCYQLTCEGEIDGDPVYYELVEKDIARIKVERLTATVDNL